MSRLKMKATNLHQREFGLVPESIFLCEVQVPVQLLLTVSPTSRVLWHDSQVYL
jgi:hypothetical protein